MRLVLVVRTDPRGFWLVDVVHILTGYVGEFRDQRGWHGAVASVLETTEVAACDVEEGEVASCFVVFGVEDDELKESEQRDDGHAGYGPVVVSTRHHAQQLSGVKSSRGGGAVEVVDLPQGSPRLRVDVLRQLEYRTRFLHDERLALGLL